MFLGAKSKVKRIKRINLDYSSSSMIAKPVIIRIFSHFVFSIMRILSVMSLFTFVMSVI